MIEGIFNIIERVLYASRLPMAIYVILCIKVLLTYFYNLLHNLIIQKDNR